MKRPNIRKKWILYPLYAIAAIALVAIAAIVGSIQFDRINALQNESELINITRQVRDEYAKIVPSAKEKGYGVGSYEKPTLSPINTFVMKFNDAYNPKIRHKVEVHVVKTRFGWLHWWRQID